MANITNLSNITEDVFVPTGAKVEVGLRGVAIETQPHDSNITIYLILLILVFLIIIVFMYYMKKLKRKK